MVSIGLLLVAFFPITYVGGSIVGISASTPQILQPSNQTIVMNVTVTKLNNTTVLVSISKYVTVMLTSYVLVSGTVNIWVTTTHYSNVTLNSYLVNYPVLPPGGGTTILILLCVILLCVVAYASIWSRIKNARMSKEYGGYVGSQPNGS